LIGQENVGSLEQAIIRNRFEGFLFEALSDRIALEKTKDSLQTFTSAIANRPTVSRGAKGPTSFGNVAIILVSEWTSFVLVRRRGSVVEREKRGREKRYTSYIHKTVQKQQPPTPDYCV
jgi:hypothetical protein